MSALYFDVQGNEHSRNEWDMHHVFPRSQMHGGKQRAWCNLRGLLIPIYKDQHNRGSESLHANVPFPPKPTPELMGAIRQHLFTEDVTDVYDRFVAMNQFVHDLAETTENTGLGKLAEKLAVNLEQQTPYILTGMVIVEQVN